MSRRSDAVDDASAGTGAGSVTGIDDGSAGARGDFVTEGEVIDDAPAGSSVTGTVADADAATGSVADDGDAKAHPGIGPVIDDDREPSADPSVELDGGLLPRGESVGFAVFPTALGECGIAWGPGGITGVHLPEESGDAVRAVLASAQEGAFEAAPPREVQDVIDRIAALLDGRSRDDLTDVRLDLSGLSGFLQRTYAITRTIAPGHTMTYGQIAERLGSPGLARAVGRAMGANPCPIIVPCHRVLGADGSIGGFSAHGGALTKRRMLLAEGVPEQDGPALFGADQLFG